MTTDALETLSSNPFQKLQPTVIQPSSEPMTQPTTSYPQEDMNYFLIIIGLAILAKVILGTTTQTKA